MRVWVTRTRPGADRTADRLRALGHEPIVAPVLAVRAVDAALDLSAVAALAFTSVNGVEAFAARTADRSRPVFAVGDATAAAAQAAGFGLVRSARGDVHALSALIAATPPPGTVLHVAGRPLAGDLEGALRTAGVEARTVVVYETAPTGFPTPEAFDVVLVHSAHAGRVLAPLLAGGRARVLAISAAAAAPLADFGRGRISIAERPGDDAMLALL